MSSNEFPVRLNIEDIRRFAAFDMSTIDNVELVNLAFKGVSHNEKLVIDVLRKFHMYLLERRIDPGFQVVLND